MELLENHVSVVDFAIMKKCYPYSVSHAIKKGKIEVDLVGIRKIKMIDFEKYKDYEFKQKHPKKILKFLKRQNPSQYAKIVRNGINH